MRRNPLSVLSVRVLTALAVAGGLLALVVIAPAPGGVSHPPSSARARLQAAVEEMVQEGTPGVVARVEGGRGGWGVRAGVGDLATGRARGAGEKFRIASVSKPFTAVVLLMLQARGRLSLQDSLERWLPKVVRAKGYRPRHIRLRHLLNHTSGIFDYNSDPAFRARYAGAAFDGNRLRTWSPRQLVDIALAHRPLFQPGQGSRPGRPGRWAYSDTNYVLAGMVIEKAAGTTYKDALERYVIKPLGLRGTSVPGTSPGLPAPHARHYSTLSGQGPQATVREVTEFNPSVAFSAGELISTAADVNTFMTRLLAGELLPPAQQRQLLAAVPVDGDRQHGGPHDLYGLGLRRFHLARHCWVWGHGGLLPGSATRAVVSARGKRALTLNSNGDWGAQHLEDAAVRTQFCHR